MCHPIAITSRYTVAIVRTAGNRSDSPDRHSIHCASHTRIMEPQVVDTLLLARWILPMAPADTLLEHCAVAVQDGRIIALVPQSEAGRRFHARETIELEDHVLLPGLVNGHTHAAMSLLRGYADDLPLHTWLNDHIWPAEGRLLSETFVRDGTELAMAEMILSGTTTFADMYFHCDAIADAASHAGLRAQISFPVMNVPTSWGQGPEDYIARGLALFDQYRSHPRIRIAFGPHAPYTVDDATAANVVKLANELNEAPIQIHVHETAGEVDDSLKQYGERPLARLHRLGLLTPQTQCVHMTQVSDGDIELLRETNASVIHCPRSNMKLASGSCPITTLRRAGVTVGLGTDGAASNNGLNLFAELTSAALLAKAESGNPAALPAFEALRMATLDSARALGLDSEIGSIETGKQADLIAVDLSGLELQPLYNPVSQLVYCSHAARVTHSWVAGRPLMRQGQLTTLDTSDLVTRARAWRERVSG